MAAVLHIVGQPDWSRALDVIRGQVAAGDTVTVALTGPGLLALPPGKYRVMAELDGPRARSLRIQIFGVS